MVFNYRAILKENKMNIVESYLKLLNEYRAENIVDFCKSLGCPRKTLKCLLRLRMDTFCKYDIECQKSVDREIEFIYQQFDNQGGKLIDPLISGEEFPAPPHTKETERPSAVDNSNRNRPKIGF